MWGLQPPRTAPALELLAGEPFSAWPGPGVSRRRRDRGAASRPPDRSATPAPSAAGPADAHAGLHNQSTANGKWDWTSRQADHCAAPGRHLFRPQPCAVWPAAAWLGGGCRLPARVQQFQRPSVGGAACRRLLHTCSGSGAARPARASLRHKALQQVQHRAVGPARGARGGIREGCSPRGLSCRQARWRGSGPGRPAQARTGRGRREAG